MSTEPLAIIIVKQDLPMQGILSFFFFDFLKFYGAHYRCSLPTIVTRAPDHLRRTCLPHMNVLKRMAWEDSSPPKQLSAIKRPSLELATDSLNTNHIRLMNLLKHFPRAPAMGYRVFVRTSEKRSFLLSGTPYLHLFTNSCSMLGQRPDSFIRGLVFYGKYT
jgi:hypothetical protein